MSALHWYQRTALCGLVAGLLSEIALFLSLWPLHIAAALCWAFAIHCLIQSGWHSFTEDAARANLAPKPPNVTSHRAHVPEMRPKHHETVTKHARAKFAAPDGSGERE